jgi:hypothetical protein
MTMAMTNQEFFDRSVAHLRKQGRKSRGANLACLYRHPDNGDGCAVGGVMPEDLIQKVIAAGCNTSSFDGLLSMVPEAAEFFDGVDVSLGIDMQVVHDGREPKDWEYGFRRVASEYGLTLQPAPEGAAA